MVEICSRPDCKKKVKAKGLCSAHYSAQSRRQAKLDHPNDSRDACGIIYVAQGFDSSRVEIGQTYQINKVIKRGLSLEAAFFARPNDAVVIMGDIKAKAKELEILNPDGSFMVSREDGMGLIKKCAALVPAAILTASQYATLAMAEGLDRPAFPEYSRQISWADGWAADEVNWSVQYELAKDVIRLLTS